MPNEPNALTEAQIQWGLPPVPHRDRLPHRLVEALSPADLIRLTEDLQDDLACVKTILEEAIRMLAQVTAERERLRRIVRSELRMIVRHVGDARYSLTIGDTGIVIEVDRIRRERHELVGELTVICPIAGSHRITPDGLIHLADFNLSSAQVRGTRAKVLRERSEAELDWLTWLELLCVSVIRAEREGTPAKLLDTFPARTDDAQAWHLHGWQLPRYHPAILFGDGGSLKSYLALYVAGTIAQQGIPVLYADWELDGEDHHARLRALFGDETPAVLYLRCERPLVDEADRIRREVGRHAIEYAVFDSVGFAVPGPPESAEMATGYFRAVRQIGVGGSLHLAHSTKSTTDQNGSESHKPVTQFRGLKPFGSVFWHNSARSTWYVRRADEDTGPRDHASVTLGLFHQKANTAGLLAPIGLSVTFGHGHTVLESADLSETDELARGLSLKARLKALAKQEPKTLVELAEATGAKIDTVKKTLYRNRDTFTALTTMPDGIHRWTSARTDEVH